jgi:hypothetical protein
VLANLRKLYELKNDILVEHLEAGNHEHVIEVAVSEVLFAVKHSDWFQNTSDKYEDNRGSDPLERAAVFLSMEMLKTLMDLRTNYVACSPSPPLVCSLDV